MRACAAFAVGSKALERALDQEIGCADVLVGCLRGRFRGVIAIADTVRPEARQAIARLNGMELRAILLTSDTLPVAKAVGAQLGIKEIEAELLPEDKLTRIRALVGAEAHRRHGDGVNDAPTLAKANVGVVMGVAHNALAASDRITRGA